MSEISFESINWKVYDKLRFELCSIGAGPSDLAKRGLMRCGGTHSKETKRRAKNKHEINEKSSQLHVKFIRKRKEFQLNVWFAGTKTKRKEYFTDSRCLKRTTIALVYIPNIWRKNCFWIFINSSCDDTKSKRKQDNWFRPRHKKRLNVNYY